MSKIVDGLEDWMQYSRNAWIAVGSPPGLDPSYVMTLPNDYEVSAYKWFETQFQHAYSQLYQEISSNSSLLCTQPEHFTQKWMTYYDPVTIWKQVLPLFVFADVLGRIDHRHISLAKAYAIGQAIPSVVVDHMLDRFPPEKQVSNDDWLFCLSAYSLGIYLIRGVIGIPNEIEERFLYYTRYMYHMMWRENLTRFQLPRAVSAAILTAYLNGESRLLSSVFYGVNIEWAFMLAQRSMPPAFTHALLVLRKVRQLNDELVDLDDDIHYGIVTYPYLHCLASVQQSQQLADNIKTTWKADETVLDEAMQGSFLAERRALLKQTGSFEATAIASKKLLRVVMEVVIEYFPANEAFSITLILNQRLTALNRLAQNQWQPISNVYQPDTLRYQQGDMK